MGWQACQNAMSLNSQLMAPKQIGSTTMDDARSNAVIDFLTERNTKGALMETPFELGPV
jgi:hypothetical protein